MAGKDSNHFGDANRDEADELREDIKMLRELLERIDAEPPSSLGWRLNVLSAIVGLAVVVTLVRYVLEASGL